MLQVNNIRENKDAYVKALSKRGIDANTILEEVLQVDETRRNTQAQLDEVLSQSNTLSKEIGMLFQKGEAQKANELKEQTTQLKEQSKTLQDQLNEASEKLQQLLFTIPNIPNELVPAGQDENDISGHAAAALSAFLINALVFREPSTGSMPCPSNSMEMTPE